MKLIQEIYRVRSLIFENEKNLEIKIDGDLEKETGMYMFLSTNNTKIGHTNLSNFDTAKKYSKYLKELYDLSDNTFNNQNTIFLYDTFIDEKYRGKGLGELLKLESHNITKNIGKTFTIGIVDCNNIKSQNLHKKLGYNIYNTNGISDLFYKKL